MQPRCQSQGVWCLVLHCFIELHPSRLRSRYQLRPEIIVLFFVSSTNKHVHLDLNYGGN